MERVLTGIKPTGIAHIGNYFGAIKQAVDFANSSNDFECYYFIADYHALTTVKTKQEMIENTYNIACTWLACGIDSNKVVFFKQSDVSEDCELFWILCNLTSKGLMNRAHAYKAIVEKNEAEGQDKDIGVNMGLYNYPILMAADILLFNAKKIPVGIDQTQHVEIARDIANSFNNRYGKVFTLPESVVEDETCQIVGLDGRKMSKSYKNTIELFCSEKQLQKTVNKIVTDSRLPGEPKDTDNTLCKLFKLFSDEKGYEEYCNKLLGGMSWGDAKKELFNAMNKVLTPMREKYDYYQANRQLVDEMFKIGAEKARKVAKETLDKVKDAIGVKLCK